MYLQANLNSASKINKARDLVRLGKKERTSQSTILNSIRPTPFTQMMRMVFVDTYSYVYTHTLQYIHARQATDCRSFRLISQKRRRHKLTYVGSISIDNGKTSHSD